MGMGGVATRATRATSAISWRISRTVSVLERISSAAAADELDAAVFAQDLRVQASQVDVARFGRVEIDRGERVAGRVTR
jgi:hypothetical protein